MENGKDNLQNSKSRLDRIQGSLVGGAIGDALGFPVEFMSRSAIVGKYGRHGITSYELSPISARALISDDTQMTLFTANGILKGKTECILHGSSQESSCDWISRAYQDWLTTQSSLFPAGKNIKRNSGGAGISWLLNVPELYSLRAPGNTCISALKELHRNPNTAQPINDSKGCGGIMRVAPVGLFQWQMPLEEIDRKAAEAAAITHGHPLGYLPAAVLAHILYCIVYPEHPGKTLLEIVIEAKAAVNELYRGNYYLNELNQIIDLAIQLSENRHTDLENISRIGEGWVAKETLGIALYCSLRYEHDFSGGAIAAVNHSGDSDSTGAVTGNILGAIQGYEGIDKKWKTDLELLPVLLEMSQDLYRGSRLTRESLLIDWRWMQKYLDIHWEQKSDSYEK